MEFDAIITAIGSLGFPIVVAIYMIWTNAKQTERHQSETKEMTEAIYELKNVITILTEKLNHD